MEVIEDCAEASILVLNEHEHRLYLAVSHFVFIIIAEISEVRRSHFGQADC